MHLTLCIKILTTLACACIEIKTTMKFSLVLFIIELTCLMNIELSYSWGTDGHEIIGNIAYERLSTKSQEKACAILSMNDDNDPLFGDDGQSCLGRIADWADAYKYSHDGGWSKPLHYVDVEDSLVTNGCHYNNTDNCTFVYERDCANDFCVAGAVTNYSTRLINHSINDNWDSLKFLVHLVGDLHQPLHVSRGSDIGGNSIHVHFDADWYGSKHGSNLHSIWDSSMIIRAYDEMSMNQTEYGWYLMQLLEVSYQEHVDGWLECMPDIEGCTKVWAEETFYEALHSAYSNEFHEEIVDGDYITKEYYYSRMRVVEKQLLKGAVRLAALLEYILENVDVMIADPEKKDSLLWKLFSTFGRTTPYVARERYIRTSK